MIEKHPITARLYGIGIPAWGALAVAGWPLAVLVALIAALVVLVGWE